MERIYIVGAKRTAIGTFGGSLKNIAASQLCSETIKAGLKQAGLEPKDIDETIIGHVLGAGAGMGPGRQASMAAGIPEEVPGYSLNILCGSGMKSIMQAANDIKAQEASLVVAGGMENMSQAPFLLPYISRFGSRLGNLELVDHMVQDGLTDAFHNYHMGITAENIAEKYHLSREEQDEFALASQLKTAEAIKEGRFREEIIPVEVRVKRNKIHFQEDEFPRPDATMEGLAKLKPVFQKEGTVTAGNASGLNDGASSVIVASGKAVHDKQLKPMAEIVAYAQSGIDPAFMGLGPVSAIQLLREKTDVSIRDVQLFELNEAFAAQSLGVLRELSQRFSIDSDRLKERVNVNGGAIALGHPIGASGNRIVVSLLYEMKKRNLDYGIASLCIGGGMGTAILLKNC